MNRRQFVGLLTAGLISIFSVSGQAAPYAFEEGIHYKKLPDNARALVAKGTVQEFFFYGCSHCHDMEKPLKEWLANKPKHIHFEAIPAVFQSPAWATLARIHFALKASDQLSLRAKVFELFLQDKARPKNQEEVADLLMAKDKTFNKAAFLKAYNSDANTAELTRAAKLSGQYQLEAVPTFVINGQYVTDLPMAGTHAKLFALIEELSQK
ncbi:MAG: thiol:disulfide interchange protein DsbA/DsbL [Gammaproteobacteria bacterium]|nr:thiol:disulfide interchange protein DsbA/DsbL [Gammaproteobacteria bacterium]